MPKSIRGRGVHLVFPIGLKNTNLVEDINILLPVKFRWIPFSGFRREVENVSANQREGRPSCFPLGLKSTNFGRGRLYLASYQVLLNSVQRFQFGWIPFNGFRGEVENVSANQRPGFPFCSFDRRENTNLVEDVEILLPIVEFRSTVLEKSKMSRSIRGRCSHFVFPIGPEKRKLGRRCWYLASCQVSLNVRSAFGSGVLYNERYLWFQFRYLSWK